MEITTNQTGCDIVDFVSKASTLATKSAAASGVITATATMWTLPNIATVIGIVCTVAATSTAIMFQYLNYKLNKKTINSQKIENSNT